MFTQPRTLFILCIALSLFSCQKQLDLEDVPVTGGDNSSLPGEYSIVNLQVKATSTASYSEMGYQVKSVTYTDYTTKNNQGVVIVDNSQFRLNNGSYSIDTTIKAYFYYDGILEDSVDAPFAMDMPTYNSSSSYTKVGSDSLTFSNSFLEGPSGTGIPVQNSTPGAKYSWSGDTLVFSSAFAMSNTKIIDGVPVTILYKGTQWTRMKKK